MLYIEGKLIVELIQANPSDRIGGEEPVEKGGVNRRKRTRYARCLKETIVTTRLRTSCRRGTSLGKKVNRKKGKGEKTWRPIAFEERGGRMTKRTTLTAWSPPPLGRRQDKKRDSRRQFTEKV